MNEQQEKALANELERVIHSKERSDKPLLNALGEIMPQAEQSFVDNLEERLMAELSTKPSKKELAMIKRKEKPNIWRYPLTLAASILAIMVLGGLALFFGQGYGAEAGPQAAFSTEIPMIIVAIAVQDIPARTIITADMVVMINFPVEAAPIDAITNLDDVIGQVSQTAIYREEVLLSRKLEDGTEFDFIQNPPAPIGCETDAARITQPSNGTIINAPTVLEGIVNIPNFSEARIEISGPSTNYSYVVLGSFMQPIITEADFGQFVPSNYDEGAYFLRLSSFDTTGEKLGNCVISIYISKNTNPETTEMLPSADLVPVVIAVQDIPMNVLITEDMVSLVYWPQEQAMAMAEANIGMWYLGDITNIVGMESTQFIGAYQPINQAMLDEVDNCTGQAMSTEACAAKIPDDMVAVILPTSDTSVANFINGQRVDIIVSMMFVDVDEEFQALGNGEGARLVMQRIISDAIIVRNEILHPNGHAEGLVMLALRPDDAVALEWIDEAELPFLIVPHLEGAVETVPQISDNPIEIATEENNNDEEITAYYPVPENFIRDYDALTTDGRGLFIAIMPSDTPDSAVAGIPMYRLSNGQRILAIELITQVGTYTRTNEDGTVETGRSARLLLTNTEASWLKQLALEEISYRYTLLSLPSLEHPIVNQAFDFENDYPLSENGLALISIPMSQFSEMPYGLVVNDIVEIQIHPQRETANTSPEIVDFVISDSRIVLENTARVVYLGNETSAMPAPSSNYSAGDSFITIELSPDDAWLVDWHIQNGAEFGLVKNN